MGSLQGRASIYDLQKKPVLNGRFFVFSHSIILSIIFPTTIHFYLTHTKNRGTRPGFSCLLYLIFYAASLHPIINLIRNFNPNLYLLLGRQGVARILQRGEACVFEALHCFLGGGEWHDVVVFAVIDMHRNP